MHDKNINGLVFIPAGSLVLVSFGKTEVIETFLENNTVVINSLKIEEHAPGWAQDYYKFSHFMYVEEQNIWLYFNIGDVI